MRRNLRNKFRIEYLGQSKNRKGIAKSNKIITVGGSVLVGHDNQKRHERSLARIVGIYLSRNGLVRVAKVKIENGFLVRSIWRLHPLEISSVEDSCVIRNKFHIKNIDPIKNNQAGARDKSQRAFTAKMTHAVVSCSGLDF